MLCQERQTPPSHAGQCCLPRKIAFCGLTCVVYYPNRNERPENHLQIRRNLLRATRIHIPPPQTLYPTVFHSLSLALGLTGEGGSSTQLQQTGVMSSILQQTSRKKSGDGLVDSPTQRAPAATFPMLFDVTSPTSTAERAVLSSGVSLLIKGKQFHIARRGLKETSGFWYISKRPCR